MILKVKSKNVAQMNLPMEQKWTHREWTCGCQGTGEGEGWTGSSGLVKKLYFNLRKDPDLIA